MNKRSTSARVTSVRGKQRRGKSKAPIHVKLGKHDIVQPNETFRVCPLGLQFYSPKKVDDFRVMDFKMKVAASHGGTTEVACAGVVVHCQQEKASGLYRVWVKFMDLAKDKSESLQCAAKNADAICPHCENF
jgi:hypothetical protein